MGNDFKRRDFLGLAFGGVAAVGVGFSLFAMKKTWDPLPSVIAAGFTSFDVSGMADGDIQTVEWRGKPVYILKKTADMSSCSNRDVVIGEAAFSIGIQICTHLGCIPSYKPNEKIFWCACHGGSFDPCGVHIFGPPPRPLEIPPFKIDGTTLVLGEEGPEYKEMVASA